MMELMQDPIPCSVTMLTFNSAATLPMALASIRDLAELVVADGGSIDGTRELVEQFGGRVVDQPPECRDARGRLVDYGMARDHLRRFATQPWILDLDSDEYLTEELVCDLRRVCVADGDGATSYSLRSRYEVGGQIIDCATNYPMVRPRLYRADALVGYSGMTDEEAIVEGPRGDITSFFIVPHPDVVTTLRKWLRYVHLDWTECARLDDEHLAEMSAFRRSSIRWFLRDFREKRSGECHAPMPLHLEFLRLGFYAARFGVTAVERSRRRMEGIRSRGK